MSSTTPVSASGTRIKPALGALLRRPDWIGVAVIAGAFLLMIFVVNPIHAFPVEDDWDYSKTVWNYLQTGVFRRLEVTQATVVFPALWGALFSKIFGFSFTTLRASTLVLAFAALIFFYALLGELGFGRVSRVLATLTLLVTPAFAYLAFSFMTDIPFFFGWVGALYCFVRAWRCGDARLALIGSALAALAFLARQVGVFIPLSFGLFVLSDSRTLGRRATMRWLLAGMAFPLVVVGLYLVWAEFLGGANWADHTRTLTGTLAFWLQWNTPGVLARRSVIAAATMGIYFLPLWFAILRAIPDAGRGWAASTRWQKGLIGILAAVFVTALVRLALRDEWFPYLTDILTRRGLRPYLAYFAYEMGAHRPLVFSLAVSAGLTVIAGGLGLGLSALIVGRLNTRMPPELRLVYLATLVLAAVSLSFFTYFERYLLPLMPGVMILLLDVTRRVRFSARLGLAGLVVVAAFSVALMRDYFAWNQVKWDAGRRLLATGVPVEYVDGGYEWNGWYLYDASVAYIRDSRVEMAIDPWKYILDPEFMFAFQSAPGYRVVEALPFATPLRPGGTDTLYLLRREPQP